MLSNVNVPRESTSWNAGDSQGKTRIALVIPCYNEEITIAEVVGGFRRELPNAAVYVFDNNSSDRTAERARLTGAIVRSERRKGKGYVVQSMFRYVDADIYVLVDGDGTYPPAAIHELIAPIIADEADMVVGSRLHRDAHSQFRFRNRLGNRLFQHSLNFLFGVKLTDILSGYRAFNRRFVKDVPLFGGGFEIETELTIKAISRGYRIIEVPVNLGTRPPDSHSKINLLRDGFLILNTILALFRDYKPLTFFGTAGVVLIAIGLLFGGIQLSLFTQARSVASTVIVMVGLLSLLAGMLAVAVGLILHTVTRRAQEQEHQIRGILDELHTRDADR